MPIVSSEIFGVINKASGRKLLMQATDHTGQVWEKRPHVADDSIDAAALAEWVVDINLELPAREAIAEGRRALVGGGQPAQHQPQADLDRKVLGILMAIEDALEFSKSLQWFRGFEQRSGPNTNSRAAYLMVPSEDYTLVAARYNQIAGVTDALVDDLARVWEDGRGW